MLYFGRIGVAAIGLVILPIFHKILGPNDFGTVAIILSIQTLLITLDFGLSLTVGRDIASIKDDDLHQAREIYTKAEKSLIVLYGLMAIAFIFIWFAFFKDTLAFQAAISIIILFASATHQNITQVAILARQKYTLVGTSQFFGILFRHVFTLGVIYYFEASINAFLYSQAIGAFLHAVSTRLFLNRLIPNKKNVCKINTSIFNIKNISWPLLINSIAGACAMQMDKSIIGALAGTKFTSAYYLASMLALAPLTFLAGPVVQFFQPKLLTSLSQNNQENARIIVRKMIIGIIATAFIPGCIIWLFADQIIETWLHYSHRTQTVSDMVSYAKILVIGSTIGSIGYIPHILLVSRKDYPFLAKASTLLSAFLLTLIAIFAYRENIVYICAACSAYHIFGAIIPWYRACHISKDFHRILKPLNSIAFIGITGALLLCCALDYFINHT
jgi:O-antigen/teichoic acid export membrane protein